MVQRKIRVQDFTETRRPAEAQGADTKNYSTNQFQQWFLHQPFLQ